MWRRKLRLTGQQHGREINFHCIYINEKKLNKSNCGAAQPGLRVFSLCEGVGLVCACVLEFVYGFLQETVAQHAE